MAKRSNGEGTIYKRKDGKWCGCKYIIIGDERCKRKYVYGKTQKAVKDKLKMLENCHKIELSKGIMLQEWMINWLEDYKKGMLKRTTYENYLMNIRKHVVGSELGKTELCELTTDMLQKFYNFKLNGSESEKKLSRRTVEYLHTIIGSALQQAYRNEIVQKNVNEFTVLPKKEDNEIEPLTIEEVQKVLKSAKKSDLYSLIVIDIFTGMRKGEILGLQWENVDFEKKILYVKKNLCRVQNTEEDGGKKTKLVLMEPKTKKSIRTIPLSNEAIKVLKEHKKTQDEIKTKYKNIYMDKRIVFANASGDFRDPREVLREFHKVLDKAGVRKCRFHDLRHTFASILLNEGESMKVIQELLGHSTITTTMDIYSHITKETKERSIERIQKAIIET